MKKIYFAGKFNLIKEKTSKEKTSLEASLVNDYRSIILGNPKLLCQYQESLMLTKNYQYLGPFYCEQASLGNFTSTDCNIVLSCEKESVTECDIFVCVFGEKFSVGSIVELGWALNLNKEIILLYQETKNSPYQIKSEYWFAIADALSRSQNIKIFKYKDNNDIISILKNILNID